MNFVKRAFLSITRRWVKTLILIVVFSVIAALMFSGICIINMSQQQIVQAKATVGSEVTLSWNYKTDTSGINPTFMSAKQLDLLSKQPHVKDYNVINISQYAVSDNFSVLGSKARTLQMQNRTRSSFQNDAKSSNSEKLSKYFLELSKTFMMYDLSLYGVRKSALSDQFISGGYKLVSGRVLTERDFNKDVILISKVLADKNKLKVGDTIRLNCSVKQAHFPFKIVGIFTTPEVDKLIGEACEETPYNAMFIPFTQLGLFDVGNKNDRYSLDNTVKTANFYLDDPDNAAAFITYAKKLLNNYTVQTNDNLYQAEIAPLEGVASAIQLLTIFTFLAGGLIFALIIIFSLRGRNHEFGVLLAIGEKRARILLQMFLEVLLPVCVAFCIGIAAGNALSGRIVNTLLSQKAVIAQQQQNQIYLNQFSGGSVMVIGLVGKAVIVSPISKLNISVTPLDYLLLAVACLLLVIIAVIVPCVTVLRYQPRRILQQK